MAEKIFRYFPSLTTDQKEKIKLLQPLYEKWNTMINVISRKDMDNIFEHHVLHSLAIAKIISFRSGTRILDVGTGGGFPGLPLAILNPDAEFTLLDSIGKKIKVVTTISAELGIDNIRPMVQRVEKQEEEYDFVIGRAVIEFKKFVSLTMKNISKNGFNKLMNGILYLKGGDLAAELAPFTSRVVTWNISEFFSEPYFKAKKIVYLPA